MFLNNNAALHDGANIVSHNYLRLVHVQNVYNGTLLLQQLSDWSFVFLLALMLEKVRTHKVTRHARKYYYEDAPEKFDRPNSDTDVSSSPLPGPDQNTAVT